MVAFYAQEQQVSFLRNSQGSDHGVLKGHQEAWIWKQATERWIVSSCHQHACKGSGLLRPCPPHCHSILIVLSTPQLSNNKPLLLPFVSAWPHRKDDWSPCVSFFHGLYAPVILPRTSPLYTSHFDTFIDLLIVSLSHVIPSSPLYSVEFISRDRATFSILPLFSLSPIFYLSSPIL